MGDLKNPRLIILKGFLFVCLGVISSVMLLALAPQVQVAILLGISIWAFCRFYYFMFYVIQHYVDPDYRFAGLISFAQYMIKQRRSR